MSVAKKLQPLEVGGSVLLNRTGAAASPSDAKAQADIVDEMDVEPVSGVSVIAQARADYEREAGPVGSMPLPAGVGEGMGRVSETPAFSNRPAALFDKLAERLAFERSGARLYEALLGKLDVRGTFEGGPTREQLVEAHEDELKHFQLLTTAIASLGGDPTALTPCADVGSVATMGLSQVIADPRTTLGQALHAILVAELVDNDGWQVLIDVCNELDADDLVPRFEQAKEEEDEHLENVRQWVAAHAMLMVRGEPESDFVEDEEIERQEEPDE